MAVNCSVVPLGLTDILGFTGDTAMDCRVAAVTVRVVEPETAPEVALMDVCPTASADASPETLTVAFDGSDELHVTVAVRSWMLLSEKIPVAVNCRIVPFAMLGLCGVTSMDCSVAAVTDKSVEPEIAPRVAEMVVDPASRAEALPVASMVAMEVADESHVTDVVRSWVLLSE